MYVAPRSDEAKLSLVAMQLAPGLQASLVASEPDLCNVVAFAFDDKGRVFVSETFRIHDGVFDTREYMQWKDDDLSLRTVEERVRKYEKHIASDIPKYAGYTERVRLLVDEDRDFEFDKSLVFADGFARLEDGIGSGALPVGGDVWFANIPALWKLTDKDGDGTADAREATFDGFGVHTSLIGHDLHGLVVGPDRRLYFSIGDRGFSVRTKEGELLDYPHEGAVLRCELDGSGLEVVHRGLRNPQELAFDDEGNLFTGDNNSDGGDRARLVQIVDGADSGWRIGFQWLDDRGAWNRERMWMPLDEKSPLATFVPILNVTDGPSGLAFDPGHGLPARYRDCLFLCDFRGGSSYSGVHALRLSKKGAGFELAWRDKPVWNVLATDVDFGPDGAMYVSDWVSGWNKTGKGRLYRVETPTMRDDMQARMTARLLGEDFDNKAESELATLLRHVDRRIRQKAQFALVDKDARGILLAAAKDLDAGKARACGVLGLGILARKAPSAAEPLVALTKDGDATVRALAARALGDSLRDDGKPALLELLKDHALQVRREAALALARHRTELGDRAITALLDMAEDNDDRDPVLRHAAAEAIAASLGARGAHKRGEKVDLDARAKALAQKAQQSGSVAIRHCAVLALRRALSPHCAAFLSDGEISVRREAARAIHDLDIQGALGALASTLRGDGMRERLLDEPFAWRAIHAARLLGGAENAGAIARCAMDEKLSIGMRNESLRILAEWHAPHGQDRVLGNWRPSARSDADRQDRSFGPQIVAALAHDALAEEAAKACAKLGLATASQPLAALVADRSRTAMPRTAALRALASLDAAAAATAVAAIGTDDPTELRVAAVALYAEREPGKAAPVLASLCEKASRQERQQAFASLGSLKSEAAATLLANWLDKFARGEVDAEVRLDLLEASRQRSEAIVRDKLAGIEKATTGNDPLAAFADCLEGGDANRGRSVFFDNEATRCTRCHSMDGKGGNAGPALDRVGAQGRAHILESLVVPGAKIAQGFATTVLELHNGEIVSGVVTKDQDGEIEVTNLAGDVTKVAASRVKSRRTAAESAMPPMGGTLSLRQLRDVVEYLSTKNAGK
jgi:quinoprotein glucose dehydrogenase